jgi:hypothetical protein
MILVQLSLFIKMQKNDVTIQSTLSSISVILAERNGRDENILRFNFAQPASGIFTMPVEASSDPMP